jgi:hypothetical protein
MELTESLYPCFPKKTFETKFKPDGGKLESSVSTSFSWVAYGTHLSALPQEGKGTEFRNLLFGP